MRLSEQLMLAQAKDPSLENTIFYRYGWRDRELALLEGSKRNREHELFAILHRVDRREIVVKNGVMKDRWLSNMKSVYETDFTPSLEDQEAADWTSRKLDDDLDNRDKPVIRLDLE